MMAVPWSGIRFAIDRGGTFTDVYAQLPDGRSFVHKLLSEDPRNYTDAPREGIRRILAQIGGEALPEQFSAEGIAFGADGNDCGHQRAAGAQRGKNRVVDQRRFCRSAADW